MRSTFVSFSEMKMVDISRRQFLIKNFRELYRVSGPLTRVARAHTSTRRVPYMFPSRVRVVTAARARARPRVCESESNTIHTHACTRTASRPNIHGIWLRYVTHTYATNQRIGTLDSSTHITSQSRSCARGHLKISFGRIRCRISCLKWSLSIHRG